MLKSFNEYTIPQKYPIKLLRNTPAPNGHPIRFLTPSPHQEMAKTLMQKLPIFLLLLGFVGTWVGLVLHFSNVESIPWIFYAAGGLSVLGFILQAKTLKLQEKELQIAQLEKRLKEDMLELDKRILQFNQKLKTYHEWMEFPADLQGATPYEEGKHWSARDQEVVELLKKQTAYFFENIKKKKYYKDGAFIGQALGEDMIALIEGIAQIYDPQAKNPLLHVSIEQLLRAINQISINLIVLLDRLPINIKKRTLQETYNYVQKGVKGFEFYEKAEPYLDYMQPLYYLGRMVLGANPVVLGATALAVEFGKVGTKHLALHISAKYALRLLHETICILSNEMASLFGGDYRHRDANWIYGIELVELIQQFPVSQEILQSSLNELGNLNLRSEYDRLFLYRCIAARQSAHPEKHPEAYHSLTQTERHNVAKGLEKFYSRFIYGRTSKRLQTWKNKVETRLGYKLQLQESSALLAQPSELVSKALFSLASFLLEIKDREIEELRNLLANTQLMGRLEAKQKTEILLAIETEPPMIFSYPELEPASEFLPDYLQDLTQLTVEVAPHDKRGDQVFFAVLEYFRVEQKDYAKSLQRQYAQFFAQQLVPQSAERKVKFSLARPLLAMLQPDEFPRFLYKNVTVKPAGKMKAARAFLKKRESVLLGTTARLVLFAIDTEAPETAPEATLLWQHILGTSQKVGLQAVKKKLVDEGCLTGGQWNEAVFPPNETPAAILIAGAIMGRYEKYFMPLKTFCERAGAPH